ncbi:MAG: prepilin-type N-terminal cleavage/methylation domain-containing protein [Candidatus Saccharibacteria bacterium]
MKNNQKGFSVVEILIVIVVVGLLGAVGWLVYDRQNNKQTDSTTAPTANNQNETAAFTDCHTEVDKVTKTLDSGMVLYEWTTVEHTKVVLSDWNVTLTLPENMVGKAVCRYTSNGYELSTKAVVDDDKCVTYYRTDELASEGVGLWKFSASTAAETKVSGATGTLEDYYRAHKATDGNYFTDPGAGRNYYKIGDSFYVAEGDANGILDKYKAARTAACKDEKPDFEQHFVEAMASLKQR